MDPAGSGNGEGGRDPPPRITPWTVRNECVAAAGQIRAVECRACEREVGRDRIVRGERPGLAERRGGAVRAAHGLERERARQMQRRPLRREPACRLELGDGIGESASLQVSRSQCFVSDRRFVWTRAFDPWAEAQFGVTNRSIPVRDCL